MYRTWQIAPPPRLSALRDESQARLDICGPRWGMQPNYSASSFSSILWASFTRAFPPQTLGHMGLGSGQLFAKINVPPQLLFKHLIYR